MKKKLALLSALILAVIISTSLFAFEASAAYTEGYYTYTVSNGEAKITDVDTYISRNITIPATLGGYPVTSIGDEAFRSCLQLTGIDIPDSVTSIGGYAFYNCTKLASITIGNGLTCIGVDAFEGCRSIEQINITDLEKWLNNWANVEFGSSDSDPFWATARGDIEVYLNGEKITGELVIPNGVTTIPSRVFNSCDGITSVVIPNGVTSIGSYAFRGCTGLTSIDIPDSVTSIGYSAFEGCTEIARVNVTELKAWLCVECDDSSSPLCESSKAELYVNGTRITEITGELIIPEGSTVIPDCTFRNCTGITSIVVADSVTSIGYDAFYGCTGLESITVNSGNSEYYSVNNCLIEKSTKKLILGCKSSVIPSGVRSIARSAFSGCTGLTSIEIPDSVTSIGAAAFSDCTGLKSIEVSDSVTSIGSSAFSGCSSLVSITLPFVGASKTETGSSALFGYIFGTSSYIGGTATKQYYSSGYYATYYIPSTLKYVTITGGDLKYGAFYNCENLISVTIGNGVTDILGYAFRGCSNLTKITVGESVETIRSYAFEGCENLKRVYISDLKAWCEIKYIYEYSWQVYHPLRYGAVLYLNDAKLPAELLIPDGTEYIGEYAFYGRKGIKSVDIPDSVTSIGSSAFSDCVALVSANIPDSVTSIGTYAFEGCTKLNDLVLGKNVISIGSYAFADCTELAAIELPSGLQSIGTYAFRNCKALASINIPDSITSIEPDTFYNCTSLTEVSIPDSVKTIGTYAFYGCSALEKVVLPGGINIIEDYTFYNCKSLTQIDIPVNVTVIDQYAFYGSGLTSVETPAEVINIGKYAFAYSKYLADIRIHGDPDIMEKAFYKCATESISTFALARAAAPTITFYKEPLAIYDSADTLSDTLRIRCLANDTTSRDYATKYNRVIDDLHGKDTCVFNVEKISSPAVKSYGTCSQQAEYYKSCECGRVGTVDTFMGEYEPHVFSKQDTAEQYKLSGASCSAKAVYYYSCEHCGAKGSSTFEYGDKLSHDFTKQDLSEKYLCSAITCHSKAVYYYACQNCGEKGSTTYEHGEIGTHIFSKQVVTDAYKVSGATCMAKAVYNYCCETCDEKGTDTYEYGEKLAHVFTKQVVTDAYKVSSANCTQKAVYNYCCQNCDTKGTETYEYGEPQHSLSENWYYGSTTHFHKCTACGEKSDVAEHTYDANDTCTVCFYILGSGVSVSGNLTSYGDDSATVKIELIPVGDTVAAYTAEITGNGASYSFDAVTPGEYVLRVSKTKHAAREYNVSFSEDTVFDAKILLYGDVNGDGKVNAGDATQIKRYYNNKTSVFTAENADTEYLKKVADVNMDNKANAGDATQIKRYYNNKTSVFTNLP